jgi:hypothetical protein
MSRGVKCVDFWQEVLGGVLLPLSDQEGKCYVIKISKVRSKTLKMWKIELCSSLFSFSTYTCTGQLTKLMPSSLQRWLASCTATTSSWRPVESELADRLVSSFRMFSVSTTVSFKAASISWAKIHVRKWQGQEHYVACASRQGSASHLTKSIHSYI